MKLLHLADLHLGKRVNGFDFLDDQSFILDEILSLCDENGVDAVALAGDIYDAPVPPAPAVLLLDRFLTALAGRGVAVLAIAGNHDSAERLDYAAGLLKRQGVYIAGQFTGRVPVVPLADEYGPVEFCLLPFARPATVRHFLDPEGTGEPYGPLKTQDEAVGAALSTLPPAAPGVRRVLLAHQTVLAGALPAAAGSESVAAALSIGTVDAVDATRFAGFTYTALGHIHRPQRAGGEAIRYAGAPLCYSLDECGAEKTVPLVRLGAAGAEVELLPLRPRRQMRHLTGPLAALTAAPEDPDDYIWATLTDETPIVDAMAILRAAYPNAMKLDYRPHGDPLTGAGPGAAAPAARSFDELFGDFFAMQNGRPLTDEERAAVDEMQKEAAIP